MMKWFYGFRVKAQPGEGPFKWVMSKPFDTEAEAKAALRSDRTVRAPDSQHTTPIEAADEAQAEGLCNQNIAI